MFGHVVRHFREALFHEGVRRESHGGDVELSLGHSID